MGSLYLAFAGTELEVELGGELTFGRAADLVVDARNQYLHRILGRFVSHHDQWYLQNLGRNIPLRVVDRIAPSRAEVGPGDQIPIGFDEFVVVFGAGSSTYEIEGALAEATPLELGLVVASDTVDFGLSELNDEQRQLVAVLGEPLLRGEADWTAHLPSNKEAARRLGWTITKFNRKLDYLCRRLSEAGVDGMVGDLGALASNRRQHLVSHVVSRGLVTSADLATVRP